MRYTDQTQTHIQVEADELPWDTNSTARTVPVEIFIARGGDLADVEPWRPFSGDADLARNFVARNIQSKCEDLITQGLVSTALGAPHTYPSKVIDQQNLAANVQRSILPANAADPNWITWHMCADASGAWQFRPHNAAQIQQAGEDLANAITLIRMANAMKQAEISNLSFDALLAYHVNEGWPS